MTEHEDRATYDPTEPAPPSREPPLRTTAPQGVYTDGQVLTGAAIAAAGVVLTVVVPLLVA